MLDLQAAKLSVEGIHELIYTDSHLDTHIPVATGIIDRKGVISNAQCSLAKIGVCGELESGGADAGVPIVTRSQSTQMSVSIR